MAHRRKRRGKVSAVVEATVPVQQAGATTERHLELVGPRAGGIPSGHVIRRHANPRPNEWPRSKPLQRCETCSRGWNGTKFAPNHARVEVSSLP